MKIIVAAVVSPVCLTHRQDHDLLREQIIFVDCWSVNNWIFKMMEMEQLPWYVL